ncbi:hypothetical protein AXI59_05415 [Bacillus nakamurai]|uniref:Uncharacterized protein n=1 Tax=Bacillus nakamurai TaxID=1793963 RepID=A0A150F7F2_9BACI|nr:hypothetical protein [Bacillus nakamurai]KXZ13324.1 hypothetical protein AXI59_05415 [Bacillus nakamurai]KXZ17519.1 hypothetical protein AXI58_19165 [Bacillus nakamurai]MCC9024195.1 hypothetical protein [Bacillus nakamurai]MCP6682387.1 hypothetical protein [Bacillus nakamurai]MED1227198.1 hypothetical protein [Bacillus nakamurai]
MRKYLGIASLIILLITLYNLPHIHWALGILGIVAGSILAIKAPKGISKYVSFVILALCILLLLFLVVMGILMAGLVGK